MTTQAKLPSNYRFVADLVLEHGAGTHLASGDLLELARRRRPGFSNATLYRALRRLTDLRLIAEVRLPGADAAAYEAAGAEHSHFQCSACGHVADVPFALAPEAVRTIAEQQRLTIAGASITFRGLCAACTPSSRPNN